MSLSKSASSLDRQVDAVAGALSCVLGYSSDPTECRAAIESCLRMPSGGMVAAVGDEAKRWLCERVAKAADLDDPACKLAAELHGLAMEKRDQAIPAALAAVAAKCLPLRERKDQFLEVLLQLDECLNSEVCTPCHAVIKRESPGACLLDFRSRRGAVQGSEPENNPFIRFRMPPSAR